MVLLLVLLVLPLQTLCFSSSGPTYHSSSILNVFCIYIWGVRKPRNTIDVPFAPFGANASVLYMVYMNRLYRISKRVRAPRFEFGTSLPNQTIKHSTEFIGSMIHCLIFIRIQDYINLSSFHSMDQRSRARECWKIEGLEHWNGENAPMEPWTRGKTMTLWIPNTGNLLMLWGIFRFFGGP